MNAHKSCKFAFAIVGLGNLLLTSAWCQKITSLERDRAQGMLQLIANDVRKHYYDPNIHGLNWESVVQASKQKIDQADSFNRAQSEIAALLDSLNDSHTYFLPPQHSYRHDYGWQAQLIGDRCYVIRVRPGSDAEAKGVRPGDELLALNGFSTTKDNFRRMEYAFNTLRPQPALRLDLRDPAGKERTSDVITKIIDKKKVMDLTARGGGGDIWDMVRENENKNHERRARMADYGDELMILKFPAFFFSDTDIDSIIGKARKCKALIVDLRGNGGGSVETLQSFLGAMFENEVKIGDRVGRDEKKPMIAKARGHRFEGKLIVLVDSRSASASELFARVVQIEKRGVIVGDNSSGSVMEAKRYSYKSGMDTVVFYGASITDADIIMTDGKSLEHAGVIPDEAILPTARDLAEGRDPVISRAAGMAGVKLSSEAAGKLFPYEWPDE